MAVASVTKPELEPEFLTRVCAFTLSTALVWLGHECRGECPAASSTWQASTWSTLVRPERRAPSLMDALIVVDFGASARTSAEVHALLDRVNACVARDHMHVIELAAFLPIGLATAVSCQV